MLISAIFLINPQKVKKLHFVGTAVMQFQPPLHRISMLLHYSDFFDGWKRDNFALTNSSVEGALFIAIVGARFTGLVGETSICLVMAS